MVTAAPALHEAADPLVDWCRRHALVVLAGAALAVSLEAACWLLGPAAVSFAALIHRRYALSRTHRHFGSANWVTTIRLLGTLALPALAGYGPSAVVACAIAVFALDGVDGWLARRQGLASEFGEYFDKEADALLMLVLCLLLHEAGRFGAWILLPGLLRYAFVVFLMLARPPAPKERRSRLGRWVFVAMTSALIAAFTPFPRLYEPLVVAMTILLAASFARAVSDLYRPRALSAAAPVRAPRLKTRDVQGPDDVVRFFDELAPAYRDLHGDAGAGLQCRLALIRRLLPPRRSLLVEIGCGNGMHLFALADAFDAAIGIDASPAMIEAAEAKKRARGSRGARVSQGGSGPRARCEPHERDDRIRLAVERAERMSSVDDEIADLVLCVGAFEHMTDQRAVLREVARVLRPGGAFVCLSPNGGALWYTRLAPLLGLDTRHLSTDRFVAPREWPLLLREAQLHPVESGYWRFVPAGDMPPALAHTMLALDRVGAILHVAALRGGCYVKALKPAR